MFKQFVCTSCGYIGSPIKVSRGNGLVQLILLLCAIIPGILYMIWRNKHSACAKCRNATIIPVDSPMGKSILKQMKVGESTLTNKGKTVA